ncbi:MAG: hypothetical protein KIT34_10905 [Cyanobacteria bacterium TGS_CYA1]|nr:hypothetical protein [Cyanobacteria bacterium TGS_CYA1]
MSKFAYITLILSVACQFASPSVKAESAGQNDRMKIWDEVNLDFRKFYADALSEKRKKFGPVIVCSGGEIILYRDGKRSAVNVVPEKFSFFKTVAHVPLAVYVALDNHCDEQLSNSTLEQLSAFKRKYNLAGESFKNWNLNEKTLEVQQSMLDDTNIFLDRVIKEKKVSRQSLDSFAYSMKDRIYKNADDAVFYELGKTDNQIALWKKDMSEEEWNKLKVIVVSPHMPRNQNRQMIYFQALLKDKDEGNRIIYMDGDPNQEEKALNLLSVHELDHDVAISFFKDPWRMHRDLLGDAGKKFVKMHKPGNGGIELDL